MSKPFTGRHMAAILVAGFGIVIAVNLIMAGLAVSTFGGVVVQNSYVASQNFNRWLDQAERSDRLGWKPVVGRGGDGRVAVELTQVPPGPVLVSAVARHPLGRFVDVDLQFERRSEKSFESVAALPDGRWIVRVEIRAGGATWRGESQVR